LTFERSTHCLSSWTQLLEEDVAEWRHAEDANLGLNAAFLHSTEAGSISSSQEGGYWAIFSIFTGIGYVITLNDSGSLRQ
jgi:hypothetical protein